MPSTPGGQLGSQDDGPSAGSHRIGRGVPLHKPEIQPLVHTGWRKAHQGSFPEFLRAITAWLPTNSLLHQEVCLMPSH